MVFACMRRGAAAAVGFGVCVFVLFIFACAISYKSNLFPEFMNANKGVCACVLSTVVTSSKQNKSKTHDI